MAYSISCTTRPPRGGEAHGRDYYFLPAAEFERRVAAGEFLEHATVHGHRYGTLRQAVVDALAAGRDVLMDIDVQGAAQIRRQALDPAADPRLRRAFVDVFIVPPSAAELRRRLEARAEDAPGAIERRLCNAALEMPHWREYRYLIVNDQLDAAYAELKAVVLAEHCRIAGG
jgi:guanylate kinase